VGAFTCSASVGRHTGRRLTTVDQPLTGRRAFNRVSGPDANSCAGCHNTPAIGGSGDFVTNAFIMAERFDFVTFDRKDLVSDLQHTRDRLAPGQSTKLVTKGVSFGTLARHANGGWNTSKVDGLPPQSLRASAPSGKPSLMIHPWPIRQRRVAPHVHKRRAEPPPRHSDNRTVWRRDRSGWRRSYERSHARRSHSLDHLPGNATCSRTSDTR